MSSSSRKSDATLLLVVLIWGINFPILKTALAVMPVFVVNVFRFVVSASVLGGIYYTRQRGSFFAPLRRRGGSILGLGVLGYVIYQIFFITGLAATTSGSAALIMASSPLWTALLSRVLRYEKLPGRAWIALLISALGTAIVVSGGPKAIDLSSEALLGNLLMLGAAVFWGAYTVLGKPILRDVSPTGLTFFGVLFALPFLVGMAVPSFDQVAWQQVDAGVWAAIFFSGGLSTGLAYVLWYAAVKRVGPSHTAIFSNLVPFVALVAGLLFLGEPVTWPQLLGGVLIIGGVMLMRQRRQQPAPARND